MKIKFIVITLLIAILTADLFWSLHRNTFSEWLVTFGYVLVLMVASFFESRWISKQQDQLKARYLVANISMWIFLLLAAASVVPNFFIAKQIDKTAFWPLAIISSSLFALTAFRRQELLRELTERKEPHSM